MGVDAEMFVKLKKPYWLDEKDELLTAYLLASRIGAEHFFVSEDHHALAIVKPDSEYGDIAPTIHQDGPNIVAQPDEQFLRVHLWSRYYGPGYERGNWITLRAVIEYLQRYFPHGEVWYGGDSSGICAEHMTKAKLKEMDDHFFKLGHEPYTSFFGRGEKRVICPRCQQPCSNNGGGGSDSYYWCAGCNAHYLLQGATSHVYKADRHTDFFELHEQVRKGELQPAFTMGTAQ